MIDISRPWSTGRSGDSLSRSMDDDWWRHTQRAFANLKQYRGGSHMHQIAHQMQTLISDGRRWSVTRASHTNHSRRLRQSPLLISCNEYYYSGYIASRLRGVARRMSSTLFISKVKGELVICKARCLPYYHLCCFACTEDNLPLQFIAFRNTELSH